VFPDPDFLQYEGILAIRPNVRVKLHIFHCECAKRPYFYFLSKIWRHHRVPRPRYPKRRGNFGDTWIFSVFHICMDFQDLWAKNCDFRGKIGEWVGRYWPQRTRSYFLGFTPLCQIWWKSTKKCDRESDDTRTDRHTHTETDRRKPILLSVPCYML